MQKTLFGAPAAPLRSDVCCDEKSVPLVGVSSDATLVINTKSTVPSFTVSCLSNSLWKSKQPCVVIASADFVALQSCLRRHCAYES